LNTIGTVVRLLLLYSVFVLLPSSVLAGEQPMNPFLLVEDPWPPYTFGESGSVVEKGLMVEVLAELSRRVDLTFRLELYPWKRCIYMVQNQKADALMLTVKTAEREKFAYFTKPFFVNKIQFYYKKGGSFSWNEFTDLKGLVIGVVDGSKYSQAFQDAIVRHDLTVEVVHSIEINLQKLKTGRIDISPVLDVVAAETIAANAEFGGEFSVAEKPLRIAPLQMAIGRSSPLMDYKDDINGAIDEMKKDGTLGAMYLKYIRPVSGI